MGAAPNTPRGSRATQAPSPLELALLQLLLTTLSWAAAQVGPSGLIRINPGHLSTAQGSMSNMPGSARHDTNKRQSPKAQASSQHVRLGLLGPGPGPRSRRPLSALASQPKPQSVLCWACPHFELQSQVEAAAIARVPTPAQLPGDAHPVSSKLPVSQPRPAQAFSPEMLPKTAAAHQGGGQGEAGASAFSAPQAPALTQGSQVRPTPAQGPRCLSALPPRNSWAGTYSVPSSLQALLRGTPGSERWSPSLEAGWWERQAVGAPTAWPQRLDSTPLPLQSIVRES